jgi:hypothetical protein
MRLLSRLDDERKSGEIWYSILRQSSIKDAMSPTTGEQARHDTG